MTPSALNEVLVISSLSLDKPNNTRINNPNLPKTS